jgi:hypothetical protein
MRALLLTACLIAASSPVLAADPVANNGLYNRSENERYVPSGKTRRVAFLAGVKNPECAPWDVNEIEVRTVQEPKSGTLKISQEEGAVGYKSDSTHAKCNGRKMRGIAVNYKSNDKFTGADEFELFVVYPNNYAQEIHYIVNVK